jgi:hypothetical protein
VQILRLGTTPTIAQIPHQCIGLLQSA